MSIRQRFLLSGSLFESVKGHAIAYIHRLSDDRSWQIEIAEKKDPRSNRQNATLCGVKYPVLMEFIGLRGAQDKQDLHEYFCGEYFGWREQSIMGRRRLRPKRTTTTDEAGKRSVMSDRDFWDFVEFVDQKAAEQGCVLPDPDPHHYLKAEI